MAKIRNRQTLRAIAALPNDETLGPIRADGARVVRIYIEQGTPPTIVDVDVIASIDGVKKAEATPIKSIATVGAGGGANFVLVLVDGEVPGIFFINLLRGGGPNPMVGVEVEIEEGE